MRRDLILSAAKRKTIDSELVITIGKNMNRIRMEKNIDTETFAAMVDFHPATINKYESGKVNIPVKSLEKIAKALNVPVEEVIKPKDTKEHT